MSFKTFTIYGEFEVPLKKGKRHDYIPVDCPDFWRHVPHMNDRGCYIFAIRAGKGVRPVYVGKTKRTFAKEVFTDHKIAQHYTPALANTDKGTPVIFLVVAPSGRGRPNSKMIGDLETFLIQVGVAKNPNLSNIQNRQEARWGIKGVVRGGSGRTTKTEKRFKTMMGL
ncbi:MAG: hypothetical protein WCV00_07060 [Verrucomicrobiia bacterium]|jgi:hypothetical protein